MPRKKAKFFDQFIASRKPTNYALGLLLFVALVFGGASRDNPTSLLVITSTACIAGLLALFTGKDRAWPKLAQIPFLLGAALIGLILLQLLPLPQFIWSALPERDLVAENVQLLGLTSPMLPLSLAPTDGLISLVWLLSPFLVFLLGLQVEWNQLARHSRTIVPFVAVCSVLLGLGQVFDGAQSPLYPYEISSRGLASGLFANANHQALLLVMTLPLLAAAAGRFHQQNKASRTDPSKGIMLLGAGVICILGLVASMSLAGLILAAGALGLSIFAMSVRNDGFDNRKLAIAATTLGTGLIVCHAMPVIAGLIMTEEQAQARLTALTTSLGALPDFLLTGAGLGSFESLVPLYETHDSIGGTFINHAHNDYVEFVLEMGMPGLILLGAGLYWLGRRIWDIWDADTTPSDGARVRKAASLSLLMVVLHSLVDYPLRTPAIACLTALCLALIVSSSKPPHQEPHSSSADENTARPTEPVADHAEL